MTTVNTSRIVCLEALGLCEHCGALLTVEDFPAEAIDAEWRCLKCKGVITNKTFGYEEVRGVWKKIQWVGKGSKWTQRKPIENFDLNHWHITIEPISFF